MWNVPVPVPHVSYLRVSFIRLLPSVYTSRSWFSCVGPLARMILACSPHESLGAGLPLTHGWGMDFKSTQVTKLNDFQLTPRIVLNMEFLPINHRAAHALPTLSQALWCAWRHVLLC